MWPRRVGAQAHNQCREELHSSLTNYILQMRPVRPQYSLTTARWRAALDRARICVRFRALAPRKGSTARSVDFPLLFPFSLPVFHAGKRRFFSRPHSVAWREIFLNPPRLLTQVLRTIYPSLDWRVGAGLEGRGGGRYSEERGTGSRSLVHL
jgi:hypothetical protein